MTDLSKIPVPSQHHIDQARQELEHLQMKLGKVEPRAILSAAQARADDFELKEVRAKCDEAREKYRALVDRFTNVDRIAEATAAIRSKLSPDPAPPKAARAPLFGGLEIDPKSAAAALEADPLIGLEAEEP